MGTEWQELSTTASSWEMVCPEVLAKEGVERPAYFEVRNGWPYCTLCRRHLTDGHLMSKNHKYRVEMIEWESQWKENAIEDAIQQYDTTPTDGPPSDWGDPAFFEWKDDWRWWCILCSQWSDIGHVMGKKHQKRVAWAEYCAGDQDGLFPGWTDTAEILDGEAWGQQGKPALDPWGPAWEARTNEPYGDIGASGSSRSSAPLTPLCDVAQSVSTSTPSFELVELSARAPASSRQADAPPGWKKVWSDEYKLDYYWNTATDETRWEYPSSASSDWC